MRQTLKRLAIGILIVLAMYYMPFITIRVQDNLGRSWRVPFGTQFSQAQDDKLIFTSFRSAYSLGKDADNAFHTYEEKKCYGKTYYYDKDNQVSFYEHTETGALPTTLTYNFEAGDACLGWTLDDEIAWPFGKIEDVDMNLSAEQAMENEWIVIKDGKTLNVGAYNDFSRMIKQGVYCYSRAYIIDGNQTKVIDIQLLEDGKFLVRTRSGETIEEKTYVRFSDKEENGKKDVTVYEIQDKDAKGIVLYTVQ